VGTVPAYIKIAEQIKKEWFSGADSRHGNKLPTQEELAERFKVSRSTIVRSLSKLVAEGYIHSQQGSGVYVAHKPPRGDEARRIGLIVTRLHAPVIVAACRGVERRARQLGYQVLLASSENSLAREEELVAQHLQAGVQGIVLYPVTRRQAEIKDDYLARWSQSAPVVTMDIACDAWPCSMVLFDNYRLGYEVTRQLIRHGHRHIAFMHTSPDYLHTSIHDRQRGWEAAMGEAGLEIPESYRGWPVGVHDFFQSREDSDYQEIAEDLLRLHPRPDSVIAWMDDVAAHLTQALCQLGVRVPEEVRLVGFDCEPLITRLFQPLFPTSRPDFVRLGELAVEVLNQTILENNAARPRTYYYPVPVLWREPRSASMQATAVVQYEETPVKA
jgi:GntR family transcriptional regulator of arabinose operon